MKQISKQNIEAKYRSKVTSKSRASRGSARDKEKKPRFKIKQVCDRKAAKRKRCPATECGVWGSAPGASAAHSLRYFSGARNRVAFVAKAKARYKRASRIKYYLLPVQHHCWTVCLDQPILALRL